MDQVEVGIGRGTTLALALAITSWLALSADAGHQEVVVTDTETTILDVVEFAPGTATLCVRSRPTLEAVAATLRGNPSIELIEVQSHTAGIDDAADLALSERRAAVIVKYLVDAGVQPSRLVAQGYGDTQPLDRATPARNERVSFLILKRSPDY